jgi:hypothetical protein
LSPGGAKTAAAVPRRWQRRRRLLSGLAVLVLAIGAALAVTIAFAGGKGPSGGAAAKGGATSLAAVTRQSLSAQKQVSGTLGYAGSSSILVPAGTTPTDRQKAQQSVASAQATLQAAQATLAADMQTLAQTQATLTADRRKLASDCSGDSAAGSGSSSSSSSGSSPCGTAAQAVATDAQAATTAEQKVTTDRGPVDSGKLALSAAQQTLATAESSAITYDTAATYTMLPSAGSVVRRGRPLYAIGGQQVLLLFGRVIASRSFRAGMSSGPDVAELNANLRALGYGADLVGDRFSGATEQAVLALQAAHGLAQTGELRLGSVVFKAGPVRIKTVIPTVGATVQAGPVLGVSTTRHQVTIALDAAQQSQVKSGNQVTITLPDNTTTAGVVSSVGSVASPGSSGSSPTVAVNVRLANQAAAGHLDQAPVQVSITTASVKGALVVPVNALLALAGGGYGVETVDAAQVHHLVAVTPGLFDDANGLVQISGADVHASQNVVVPAA